MSDKGNEGEDFTASFNQAFKKTKSIPAFGSVDGLNERRTREKRAGKSQEDGRTAAFNMRCSPAFKRDVADIAKARGMTMADLLHKLVADAKAKG